MAKVFMPYAAAPRKAAAMRSPPRRFFGSGDYPEVS